MNAGNAILTNVFESTNAVQIADCVERPLPLGKKIPVIINPTDRIRRTVWDTRNTTFAATRARIPLCVHESRLCVHMASSMYGSRTTDSTGIWTGLYD